MFGFVHTMASELKSFTWLLLGSLHCNFLTINTVYTGGTPLTATLGEHNFGRYIGVAFIEGLFCTQTVHLEPGCLAVIQRWPLFRGGC